MSVARVLATIAAANYAVSVVAVTAILAAAVSIAGAALC